MVRRETCDHFCTNNSATSKPNLKPFSPGTPNKQQLQVHYAQVTIFKGKNFNTDLYHLQNFSPPAQELYQVTRAMTL